MKRKYLDLRGWKRIKRRRTEIIRLEGPSFYGYASAVWMDGVESPLVKQACGERLVLADDGYLWVQLLPDGEHWALTMMLNSRREPVQFYFDITLQNTRTKDGCPCFDDLYLDVVFLPDGRCALLDGDELAAALASGEISEQTAELAKRQARAIKERYEGRREALRELGERALGYFEKAPQ